MKRLQMLLVPLFTMPFLVGCKFGSLDAHRLTFDFEHCKMKDKDGVEHDDDYSFFTNQEETYTFTLIPDDGFVLRVGCVWFINSDTNEVFESEDCTYDEASQRVSVKMTINIRVHAVGKSEPQMNY